MTHAFICDAIRTPFGRYGGALSSVRADDLGAIPIKALMARNPQVNWAAILSRLRGEAAMSMTKPPSTCDRLVPSMRPR